MCDEKKIREISLMQLFYILENIPKKNDEIYIPSYLQNLKYIFTKNEKEIKQCTESILNMKDLQDIFVEAQILFPQSISIAWLVKNITKIIYQENEKQ
jgi:hypothetical protein